MLKFANLIKYLKKITDTNKSIIVYFSISAILFYFYKYSSRQDLISYLSISEKYYNGDINNAINGVWGSLISWLMIPLNYINVNLILSFKFLQIIIGAFTLKGIIGLFNIFEFEKHLKYSLIVSVIIIIEYYVFLTGTPDLLFACILLYLVLIFLKLDENKIKFGIYSGLLGALLYFAKPFGFPLFILLYIAYNILSYALNLHRRRLVFLKNILIGIFVFSILILPWIYLICNKYDKITFSMGGEYNFAIVGPKYNGVHLSRIEKLYEPANYTAISYWEDPSFLIASTWNPFDSIDNFFHLLRIVSQNIIQVLQLLIKFAPILPLLMFFVNAKKVFGDSKMKLILLVGVVYISGFLLLFIEQRFLIVIQIILIVILGKYILNFLSRFKISNKYKMVFLLLLFMSLSLQPLYSIIKHLNDGKDIFRIASVLEKSYDVSGNIASLSKKPLNEDWGSTLTISYLLNSKYYGEVNSKLDENAMHKELKKYNISYLFVWDMELNFKKNYFSEICRDVVDLNNTFLFKDVSKDLIIYKVN